jgi:hypothetical protein
MELRKIKTYESLYKLYYIGEEACTLGTRGNRFFDQFLGTMTYNNIVKQFGCIDNAKREESIEDENQTMWEELLCKTT